MKKTMLDKIKSVVNMPAFVVSLGILVLGVAGVVAFEGQNNGVVIENQTVQGDYVSSAVSDEPMLGAFSGERITLNDVEYGAALSQRLDFSAGATTTPGGLFRILNGREDRICTTVTVDIATADQTNGRLGTGHPFDFSVTTSTSVNTITGSGTGIIATTTNATGTATVLNSVVSPGSSVADPDESGHPWKWTAGTYLLGQFDSVSTDPATSSDAYTGMAGKVYVDCIVE